MNNNEKSVSYHIPKYILLTLSVFWCSLSDRRLTWLAKFVLFLFLVNFKVTLREQNFGGDIKEHPGITYYKLKSIQRVEEEA